MSTPALPIFDTSGFPPAPTSDLAQALADTLKRAGAAEDHLAREVRSAQALQDRVAELEALCAHLGVAATFRDKAAVFLDLAEVREADERAFMDNTHLIGQHETVLLNGPEIRAALTHFAPVKVDDHARDRSGCRMCAAAMVLRRASPSDEAEVLLLQRASTASYGAGAWTLPAGGVTPADRSLIDTAARELLEETGLILNGCPRVVRLVDGLTPTTGGRAYACAIVLGTVTHPHVVYNREPDTHSGARWFKVADLPVETWDREMLIEIMGREEDAHWDDPSALPNLSITQKLWADPAERLTVRHLPFSEMKVEGLGGFTDPASGLWIECNTPHKPGTPRGTIIDDHGAKRRDFFATLDNAEQVRSAQAIVDHGQDNLDALLGGVK